MVAHGGSGMTLNNLSQNGFWILSANVVVRRMIYRCVNCRKLRGKFDVQKMADLPKVRRGPVRSIKSYNGTNFVGAANKLRKALDKMSVRSSRSDNVTNFVGAANESRKALDKMNHEQVNYL